MILRMMWDMRIQITLSESLKQHLDLHLINIENLQNESVVLFLSVVTVEMHKKYDKINI